MSAVIHTPQRVTRPRRQQGRLLQYFAAALLTTFMLLPIYLITIAAFSPRREITQTFPKAIIPTQFSTETLLFFLRSTGVGPAFRNSIIVGILTLVLALLLGAPAGYALARFGFRGRDSFKLLILSTRAFPIVILSIPLAVTFISWRLYDTIWAIVLAHTALALPTTILVTSSVFVGVPKDLEEAAETLGCTPFSAFWRVVLPLALPGLTAAAIFTFVLSWNEVFAATILTISTRSRTLPALVLAQLNNSPLPFRFAGGFALVVPSLVFIFFMRRYLLNMWGRVTK